MNCLSLSVSPTFRVRRVEPANDPHASAQRFPRQSQGKDVFWKTKGVWSFLLENKMKTGRKSLDKLTGSEKPAD